MKVLIFLATLSFVGSCATKSYKEKVQAIKDNIVLESPDMAQKYGNSITAEELESHITIFASATYEGRATGTKGQKLAADYLQLYYETENIPSPIAEHDYFQEIPSEYFDNNYNDSENVLAYIKGSEKPHEVIIISGHYDHEGISEKGEIYFGADDNSSGTAALLEIAQAFKTASDDGYTPKRSILFLHLTAEEIGLHGSRYYSEHPIFPLNQTVTNLNTDMIGRVGFDYEESENQDYIYLIGSDKLSTELHYISEAVNNQYVNLYLDYEYNDLHDKNKYYYRSDHYNFAKNNIPVIFYFSGEHEDYHETTDTPDKINYPLLEKRAKLIFATAWQLANQDKRIIRDK